MTMANEPADDDAFSGVFGSDRDDRGGKEPAPSPQEDKSTGTGQPRDDHGRFAAKSQSDPPAPAPEAPVDGATDTPAPDAPPPDPSANRSVPLSELIAERKKYQARLDEISRLQAESDARAKAYEQLVLQQQRPAEPQKQEPQRPDPFIDPEGALEWQQRQFDTRLTANTIAQSEHFMRMLKPDYDEVVQHFYAAAAHDPSLRMRLGQNPAAAAQFAYDYGKFAMAWNRIGNDPEAYEKRIAEQAQQKILADLKAGKLTPSGPAEANQQPRFPATLASATATGPQGTNLTDEGMAASVFGSDRASRRRSA